MFMKQRTFQDLHVENQLQAVPNEHAICNFSQKARHDTTVARRYLNAT